MAPIARAQLAGVQMATLVVAAVRAHEAVGPAQPEEGLITWVFIAAWLEKCVETEAFLERDRIALPGILFFNQLVRTIP